MTYQASKQEDRFHCWPHMVGLAKAHPNKCEASKIMDWYKDTVFAYYKYHSNT